ncbi:hypothetical protein LGT39_14575 [Demequina sp. TTPB684]|uniref:hypothetical protein n=1 Tax=unclassified Demequina TaxID=2620311 RepID=UPI001CF2E133|nr:MULTISPECIES: hypothetical protein [unclassified Demequina]MCB2414072.1 hypothetical protein [Demequina sp. TTPB684]UPU89217.1 hypothetical protein LGT36_004640 [Demequina sp. TMPB413]
MLVVTTEDVGGAALARMRRDGVLTALTDDAGAAHGPVPLSVARALSLRAWVPRRAAVTGLAALWVHGAMRGKLSPAVVEVVVPRGAHPDVPLGIPRCRWSFCTNPGAYARAATIAGVRVVHPADAVASALRGASLEEAIPAVYSVVTLRLASTEELRGAVWAHQGGAGSTRMRAAWQAVSGALEAARTGAVDDRR